LLDSQNKDFSFPTLDDIYRLPNHSDGLINHPHLGDDSMFDIWDERVAFSASLPISRSLFLATPVDR
jgi:hypothetical protein